jgi:hypothetical protein
MVGILVGFAFLAPTALFDLWFLRTFAKLCSSTRLLAWEDTNPVFISW